MSRLHHSNQKRTKPRYRINVKNYHRISSNSRFSAKNFLDNQSYSTDRQNENPTPTSTPIIASNSQDNPSTPVEKIKFQNDLFKGVYKTGDYLIELARNIQIAREETAKYKYLAQQLSSYTGKGKKIEKVPTPFGSVTVSYKHNRRSVDKFIHGGIYSSYKSILRILDRSDYSKEIAKDILKYLETSAIDNFKDFSDVQIEPVEYIDNLSAAELICAKVLSAILMVSEPSQNRNYCGGALERALLRTIVSRGCNFSDVINKELYQQMQKYGAIIARMMMHISDELAVYFSPQVLDFPDNANDVPLVSPPTFRDCYTQ